MEKVPELPPARPGRGISSKLGVTALKIAVTGLAVWLIARKVDFAVLWPVLERAQFGWVLLAVATYYGVAVLNGMRWQALMAIPGVGLRKYLYYVLVGIFLSLFLPSAALAEGARTYAFGRRYGEIQRNFAAALFARAAGLVVQIVVVAATITLSWRAVVELLASNHLTFDPGWTAASLAAAGGLAAVTAWWFRDRVGSFVSDFIGFALRDRRRLLRVLLHSLGIQFGVMLGTWALFRAVGAELALWHVALIPNLIAILLLVPMSLGGIGVREYLNILFFGGLAGVAPETTLAASLLVYAYLLPLAATGGAWMLYRRLQGRDGDD